MSEHVIYLLIAVYAAGFITGGLFCYDLGKQVANRKNIERINKILSERINSREQNK